MENVFSIIFLAVFVPLSAWPYQALAFEATLPSAPAQELLAQVYLKDRDSDLLITNDELPTDSYTSVAAAAVYPAIITERGKWPTQPVSKRLAYAVPTPTSTLDGPLVLEGEASYYSRAGCLGCDANVIMANGQPLNDSALTMAIGAHLKHLVGHEALVTSLATGKSVKVRITDTGGFYQAKYGYRVADLTVATKEAIGIHGGVGQVRVEVY